MTVRALGCVRADGLIDQITETGPEDWQAVTTFAHDRLNRLTRETRTGSSPYDLEYTYDDGGNRRMKIDNLTGRKTTYFYDIDNPGLYGSNANRLVRYEVRNPSSVLLETVWFGYLQTKKQTTILDTGWVEQVIRKIEGDAHYYRNYFMYDTAGRVWLLVRDKWTLSGATPVGCTRTLAREFRYDSGRARHLMRDVSTTDFKPGHDYDVTWTDYGGDQPHGDYALNAEGTATTAARHMPGLWEKQGSSLRAHHGDQVGSDRLMTNAEGSTIRRAVYTAFGEPVYSSGSPESRYGYAGAFGYETFNDSAIHYVHVGERWYDPATGRFLQRDPTGIRGGFNVYAYVHNIPAELVDPSGLDIFFDVDQTIDGIINGKPLGVTASLVTAAGAANYKYRLGIGTAVNRSGAVGAGLYLGWNAGKWIDRNTGEL